MPKGKKDEGKKERRIIEFNLEGAFWQIPPGQLLDSINRINIAIIADRWALVKWEKYYKDLDIPFCVVYTITTHPRTRETVTAQIWTRRRAPASQGASQEPFPFNKPISAYLREARNDN